MEFNALRSRAQTIRRELAAKLPQFSTDELIPADKLLEAAAGLTDFSFDAVPADSSLLGGAQAVLRREEEMIYYRKSESEAIGRRQFAIMHEFAHIWLHTDLDKDSFTDDDEQLFTADSLELVGYSPAQKMEQEANLFAAEVLLPGSVLRRCFLEDSQSATEIANRVGLTKRCVLAQMASSMLLDPGPEPEPQSESSSKALRPLLESLDPSQREAAFAETGPLLIDAGPGTGKTRTLIARILYLVQKKQADPEQILALTFSNHAANELQTRLQSELGDRAHRVWISTFHTFGLELLRRFGGFKTPPRLLDISECSLLLEENLGRLPLKRLAYPNRPSLPFADVLRCISRAKDELADPEAYLLAARNYAETCIEEDKEPAEKMLETAGIYKVYEELLREHNCVDFGDLILRAVRLLQQKPEVREEVQRAWPFVLADEYQDVNRACAHLLQEINGPGSSLWVVGDLRQSIYAFRGASPDNILRFEEDFPGGSRRALNCGYRSLPALTRLFGHTADAFFPEPDRPTDSERWQAARPDQPGPSAFLVSADDETAVEAGLFSEIQTLHASGRDYREFAILCRTNNQAAHFAVFLKAQGIPVQAHEDMWDSPEVRDLVSILKLTAESSGAALWRVRNFPEYQIPPEDVPRLWEEAKRSSWDFPAAIKFGRQLNVLSEAGRQGLTALGNQLNRLLYAEGANARRDGWTLLARYLFDGSNYLRNRFWEHGNSTDWMASIHDLLACLQSLVSRLAADDETQGRAGLIRHIENMLEIGRDKAARSPNRLEAEGVRVMTLHAAKGLEFPVVFIPCLSKAELDGKNNPMVRIPPGLADDSDNEYSQEQASLLFVGMSRAQDRLYLAHCANRTGKAAPAHPLFTTLENLSAADWTRIHWPAVPRSNPPEAALTPAEEKPTISSTDVETYRDCPRKYYYQKIIRPPVGADIYLQYIFALREQLLHIRRSEMVDREELRCGARDQLKKTLLPEISSPEEQEHLQMLLSQAEQMLAGYHPELPDQDTQVTHNQDFSVLFPDGTVRVSVDEIIVRENGKATLIWYRYGREKKKGVDDPIRLALLQTAGMAEDKQTAVQVEQRWLTVGEDVPVAPQNERNRKIHLDKCEKALAGIRKQDFKPCSNHQICGSCPYFFLCPT